MDKLDEFLKKDADAMEARQYRYREQEIMRVNNVLKEVEAEDKKKKADFRKNLEKLGVKFVEKNERKD